MDAFNTALEQQKEDTLDITADMMRQYKAMQEQLLKKVAQCLAHCTSCLMLQTTSSISRDKQVKVADAYRMCCM